MLGYFGCCEEELLWNLKHCLSSTNYWCLYIGHFSPFRCVLIQKMRKIDDLLPYLQIKKKTKNTNQTSNCQLQLISLITLVSAILFYLQYYVTLKMSKLDLTVVIIKNSLNNPLLLFHCGKIYILLNSP